MNERGQQMNGASVQPVNGPAGPLIG